MNSAQSFDPRVDAYINKSASFAQPILTHVRELIHRTLPDITEDIKWSMPFFLYKGQLFGNIAAFKAHCSFGLFGNAMRDYLKSQGVDEKEGMGSMGKIASVKFARERNVPFFGICLGMQMACKEGARNTASIANGSTTEFGETSEPVVGLITEWMSKEGLQKRTAETDLGGTMRLGAYPARLTGNSVVSGIYGATEISERHRHRYEVNAGYREPLEKGGLIFSGMSPDGTLPEIVERPDHPWFVGVQFHPELKSKPFDPHPLFASFIEAAVKQSRLV